jgi:hypothetical protein
MTTWRRIERCDKSVPAFVIEPKDAPISKPRLNLGEGGVKHELADRFSRGCCSRLQRPFRGSAQPKIKLLRSTALSGRIAASDHDPLLTAG